MEALALAVLLLALISLSPCSAAKSLYDLAAVDIDGQLVALNKYRGTVSLVVNVASFCGLTKSNYQELVAVQRKLGGTGKFQVLAFPCNQFNAQEPKKNSEIKQFAEGGYRANFPMFAKTTVNPPMCEGTANACDAESSQCCPTNKIIYTFLKSVFDGPIEWNFEKFLVDDQGIPIKRYAPATSPLSIVPDIEAALAKVPGALLQASRQQDPREDSL